MGDCDMATPNIEGEAEDLIAQLKHISKALETKKNLTGEERKILANLGSKLSTLALISTENSNGDSNEEEEDAADEAEQKLNKIREKIDFWEKEQSMIWDSGPDEAYEYLKSVDELKKITESLEGKAQDSKNGDEVDEGDNGSLLRQAHDILQTAMSRLEEEFTHLLVHNRQPFEPEQMSFRSSEDELNEAASIISSGGDSTDDVAQRDSLGRSSEEYIIELIHPYVIPDLKNIANLMFDSDYGRECSQAFVNVQKDALDDCLFILEVERMSIEDVLRMEWNALNSKIRRWIRAMKIFVRVYLSSEKLLCDQIFGEIESVSSDCFVESSKTAVLQLLNFGEAVSIGPRQPEKLIRVLHMYEVLEELIPDVSSLYGDEAGAVIKSEFVDTTKRLGECAKMTFLEFEEKVGANVSPNAFPGGGVHHLTRYVMNYVRTLMDYSKTLDEVFKEDGADFVQSHENNSNDEDKGTQTTSDSPMGVHFRSLVMVLEAKLEEKAKMYREEPLQQLFLTNNIHYMAEKVKNSELRTVLGDEWIRKHNWKFQRHAMNYEKATWSSILSLLKDEGIHNPGSNSVSKTLLKERLQSFYTAFEDVYKSQTSWSVRDPQLREDLRISTSLKVIQAYRTFVGRHINHISEKHIKYSADDLEDFLMDLFEGSQKSLHGGHKK